MKLRMKFSPRLGFNARIICNLVSRGFPLFEIKSTCFVILSHPLLVTFDVVRPHVVTEKNQFKCAIFRIYSNPKILQISF